MNQKIRLIALLLASVATASLVGCGDSQKKQPNASHDAVTASPPATVETEHEHAHPSEGPHNGNLVELGNEQYHAEVVHDDAAGTVTIYILDSAAKSAVPIDAAELTVNITHEGQGEQFKIPAKADDNDPSGKASRFVSEDKELAEELDHEHAEAQIVITIDGKQFRGEVSHNHEGHDHANSESH